MIHIRLLGSAALLLGGFLLAAPSAQAAETKADPAKVKELIEKIRAHRTVKAKKREEEAKRRREEWQRRDKERGRGRGRGR
jgi:hypothetical protein